MTFRCLSVLIVSTLVGASAAPAAVVVGNPTTGITSPSASPIYIDHVVAKPCYSAPVTISVGDDVSSSSPLDVDLGEELWCYLYVELEWSSGAGLQTVQVTGFTTYETLDGEDDYVISLDPSTGSASLIPDSGKS